MSSVHKLQKCAVSPTGKHSASIMFLHGSGDTGLGLRAWVRDVSTPDFTFPHIKVIYPTAPARPYTPMRGALSHVWFDRHQISPECPEHLESVEAASASLSAVIQDEVRAGVPRQRMIIGGFSMGGAMALHLACRHHPDVAGVFALSSFLNKDSVVYQAVQERAGVGRCVPELFQCHGSADQLVLPRWGKDTARLLQGAGLPSSFHSFPGLHHQLAPAEMELLRSWVLSKLPLD
ncbi:lysophospholipase-like protein 1 [Hypomesus transpacificus]|uniref:lysophospholipase-like protein 1 n=1 Tax=Hypomesus transpacificus TaxID=137520 RepID=UPI001F074778|nr:lysophospholipase-like protein 1 [Hypomesus transpacificus]